MVKVITAMDGTLEVTGKTFEHKEQLKHMGARWNSARKCWGGIAATKENKKILKTMTTKRHCGHCGEVGHFKPNCVKYHMERKKELQEKAAEMCANLPWDWKKHEATGFCHCQLESFNYGYKDFSVLRPVVCGVCRNWCCNRARPDSEDGKYVNSFNFTCPCHGSSIEQLMNDTRGT